MTPKLDNVTTVPKDILSMSTHCFVRRKCQHAHLANFTTRLKEIVNIADKAKSTTRQKRFVNSPQRHAHQACISISILANANTAKMATFMTNQSYNAGQTAHLTNTLTTTRNNVS